MKESETIKHYSNTYTKKKEFFGIVNPSWKLRTMCYSSAYTKQIQNKQKQIVPKQKGKA